MDNNILDTKMIIINLLKEDKKTYTSLTKLIYLTNFIYKKLIEKNLLKQYKIHFDINFDAIYRTVLYNNTIFDLDIDGEMIFLREKSSMSDLARQYKVDNNIIDFIHEFQREWVA